MVDVGILCASTVHDLVVTICYTSKKDDSILICILLTTLLGAVLDYGDELMFSGLSPFRNL